MDRVTHQAHPDYIALITDNRASRPARVEVSARGQTFTGNARYPKGSLSPDPASYMTDAELVAKFRHNADGMLTGIAIDDVVDTILNLESARDMAEVMGLFRSGKAS